MLLESLYHKLEKALEKNAIQENAFWMKNYMRNQFDYYGIKSPVRKEIVKLIFENYQLHDKDEFLAFVERCWSHEKREFKYVALDLSFRFSKKMDPGFIAPFESLIARESWWDTVDGIAPGIIGTIVKRNLELRDEYCNRWIESDNFWYQRSAIILQLKFGNLTDFECLQKLILRRADSKEFFVQKASGWALRQYSKTHPDLVKNFIRNHKISALAAREGMKIILKTT
ncbi:MAG: DNA alkylation repair protein [Saprospiraceae bacterium]